MSLQCIVSTLRPVQRENGMYIEVVCFIANVAKTASFVARSLGTHIIYLLTLDPATLDSKFAILTTESLSSYFLASLKLQPAV